MLYSFWVYLGLLLLALGLLALLVRHIRAINRQVDQIAANFNMIPSYLTRFTQHTEMLDHLYHILKIERGTLPPTGGWAAAPDFLVAVSGQISLKSPKVVAELGSGTSTMVIARMLQRMGIGHLYSYDHDITFLTKTRGQIVAEGLEDYVTFYHCPIEEITVNGQKFNWYSLPPTGITDIDILVVDGPPKSTGGLARYPAGPIFIPHMAEQGVLMFDDAIREQEQEIAHCYHQEFPEWKQKYVPLQRGLLLLSKGEFK